MSQESWPARFKEIIKERKNMNKQFTPSPWTVNGNTVLAREYGWSGAIIAQCDFKDLKSGTYDTLKSEANARLIAAAPDLFEALVAARQNISRLYPENEYLGNHIDYLDSVIAKVAGQDMIDNPFEKFIILEVPKKN